VAVYHRGRLVVDLWGGVRGRDRVPWTRDTLAMCGSTTKGVVATCAHVLADRGELDYDERVATYWPEFAQNGKGDVRRCRSSRSRFAHRWFGSTTASHPPVGSAPCCDTPQPACSADAAGYLAALLGDARCGE
jgi:CubicO group peptidase (beta-lactamase class C family)